MNLRLRNLLVAVAAALVVWMAFEIYHAGGDIPPPPGRAQTILTHGNAAAQRLHLPSWSLDYDSITMSPDNATSTLENIRDGIYFRNGKPYMAMKAKHAVVNTISNDFVETGPIDVHEIDGKHSRRFVSDAAIYNGAVQTLILNHPTTITDDGATIKVKSATVNFKTGETKIGQLIGTY